MFDTVQHRCARTSVDVRVARNRCSLSLSLSRRSLKGPDIVVLLAAARDKKDGSPMRAEGVSCALPHGDRSTPFDGSERREERKILYVVRCSEGFIRERDEWERENVRDGREWFHGKGTRRRQGQEKRMETVLGLKEERKSIAFISYTVNLVSGSNDS